MELVHKLESYCILHSLCLLISSTSQFVLATFQMLNCFICLVATILDDAALDQKKLKRLNWSAFCYCDNIPEAGHFIKKLLSLEFHQFKGIDLVLVRITGCLDRNGECTYRRTDYVARREDKL